MTSSIIIENHSISNEIASLMGGLIPDNSCMTYEKRDNSFVIDIRGFIKFDFSTQKYTLYLKPLSEKLKVDKTLMSIPQCCKDDPYAYIDIKINDSFSNKIMLCQKHYLLHAESQEEFVSIRTYVLEKESTENNKVQEIINSKSEDISFD